MLVWLVQLLFGLYSFAIIARVFIGWTQVDPYHPAIQFLYRITEPVLAPLRSRIPPIGMVDISPLVALLILFVLERIVIALLIGLV